MTKEINEIIRQRGKWDLQINILKLINEFKSIEEPSVTLTEKEINSVLCEILNKRLK